MILTVASRKDFTVPSHNRVCNRYLSSPTCHKLLQLLYARNTSCVIFAICRAQSQCAYRVCPNFAGHINEGGKVRGKHVGQGAGHAGLLGTALCSSTLQDLC